VPFWLQKFEEGGAVGWEERGRRTGQRDGKKVGGILFAFVGFVTAKCFF